MVLSHPHTDHFMGMHFVLQSYTVVGFATEDLQNKAPSFQHVMGEIQQAGIPTRHVFAGDRWKFGDGVVLEVAGPTEEYLKQTSPGGVIGENKEFANIISHISYGAFDVLLTGDSQAPALARVANELDKTIEVLQSPHHGSATGLEESVLDALNPKLGVISVGRNNYGHPTKKILDMFAQKGIKLLRTDKVGDVDIVSDGKEWRVL